ncbi:phage tail protein [Cronobacter sakazakii]|nr:phage tail protein [Cronobacter sakazakii]KAB0933317.1 phage tail protein [Cronobacter sakazakii]
MSQTVITLAFEQWKAQQGVTGEAILLDEFVFANVPGLNPDAPISRSETLPPAAQIVHRQAVSRKGVMNENAVVHSVVLGADVGDFSFNWIGLMNKASGTLAMIVHAPVQQKLKTKAGQQGNVLTRSFLMEYNGAQAETGINTPAETWQIDFTARLAGMDERQRLENIDVFGAAAFLGDGWLVGKTGTQYFVTPGTGYVQGLRAQLAASQNITVTTKPVKVWLDVSWEGSLVSSWQVKSKVTVAANLADYVQNGVQHYVFALASIDASGKITDLRPKGSLSDQALKEHEKSRNHPDATTSDKGFVQLSSATDSDSESQAATPLAVKKTYELAKGKYTAQDASTMQKGIVQLSSATNSESESEAATSKAIKAVNDNAIALSKKALPLAGGTMSGAITGDADAGAGSYASQNNDGVLAPFFQLINDASESKFFPVIKQRYAQGKGTWSLGTIVKAGSFQLQYISADDPAGKIFTFNKDGQFSPASYANFDARYFPLGGGAVSGFVRARGEIQSLSANSMRIVYGNYGTFWRNDGDNLYLMLTNSGDQYGSYNSLRSFTVSLSTGRVLIGHGLSVSGGITGSGQFVPSDYGNFDARYSLKTAAVIDVRQGSPGTIVLKRNGWNYVPGGCAFTGWYVEGDAPVDDTIQYKPIQININGAWRTISG